MVKSKSVGTVSGGKKILVVASFVVTLLALFFGGNALLQWNEFKPYNKIANELNETLGGGYKITKNWYCGIESNNCPSVRMIKDADFKDNDEAKVLLEEYRDKLGDKSYETGGLGVCEQRGGFKVYCTLDLKKDGLVVSINAKQDFVGIDIQP